MRFACLIILAALCVIALGDAATPPSATQPAKMTDAEARHVYDAAMKAAADNYKAAVARADQQYAENLTAALTVAMAKGPPGLDDARRIDDDRQAAAALAADHANSSLPSAAQPPPPPSPVYLSTLGPTLAQTFVDGGWGFGANGYLGNVNFERIEVAGTPASHGLGTQPPSGGCARIVYDLDRQFSDFSGSVAIADSGKAPRSALVFHINANGQEVWHSTPIFRSGRPVPFKVDLSGVSRLEMVVDCPGANNDDHAVWVDPILKPVRP